MGTLVELCKSSAVEDIPLSAFEAIAHNADQYELFDPKHVQSVVSAANRLLGRNATRHRGLVVVKMLTASEQDVVADNGHVWLQLCVNALKPSGVPLREKALALSIIRMLLLRLSKVHELDRSTITGALGDLIECIGRASPALHLSILSCCLTLLETFPRIVGSFKIQLEKFFVTFLDSQNAHIVSYAARCMHLLQQVRGGGEQGINHKSAWKNQFELCLNMCDKLIASIHSVSSDKSSYDMISYFVSDFDTVDNTKIVNKDQSPFYAAMNDICCLSYENEQLEMSSSNKAIIRIISLFTRLKNLLVFIQSMLIDPYPVSKNIKCTSVLNILLRCLSLNLKLPVETNTPEHITVISQVPALQVVVMYTIEAFLNCIHTNVLPYASLLFKMILQVLETTKDESIGIHHKPFMNIRKSAYQALSLLFSLVSTYKPLVNEGDQGFEDKLISNFLSDIIFHRPSLQLSVKCSGVLKNMSKKARNKFTMAQLESSNLPQGIEKLHSKTKSSESIFINEDLAQSALKCMGSFFKSSGIFLKQSSLKLIQEELIKQAYDHTISYNRKEALLNVLHIVHEFQSYQQPSAIPYCLNIFSGCQSNSNLQIKHTAHILSNLSVNSLHGSLPTLHIPSATSATVGSRAARIIDKPKLDEVIDIDDDIPDLAIKVQNTKRKNYEDKINKSKVNPKKLKNQEIEIEILESSEDDCTMVQSSSELNEEADLNGADFKMVYMESDSENMKISSKTTSENKNENEVPVNDTLCISNKETEICVLEHSNTATPFSQDNLPVRPNNDVSDVKITDVNKNEAGHDSKLTNTITPEDMLDSFVDESYFD